MAAGYRGAGGGLQPWRPRGRRWPPEAGPRASTVSRVLHHTPSGTRDVLPDEMRELRAITEAMRGVFEVAGYGEVYTAALEYETPGVHPAYRLFDATGNVMMLRSDMTVPIARVVATRYA